ncbi:MAG: Lrp/AsnC ligand binding domain-containing protein [Candidatus Bathyarchaeia archaeon]
MYACILVRAMPGKVMDVLKAVKGIKGVIKAFPVYGRYDIVAFIEAPDFKSVSKISEKINAIEGIRSTETAIQG